MFLRFGARGNAGGAMGDGRREGAECSHGGEIAGGASQMALGVNDHDLF